MEMSAADLGADLENDLADLYARIKALPRLKEAQDTLQHMESQRRQHAKRAAEISQRYALPGGVRFRGVIETQNRLEQAISDAVVQDPDPAAVYRRLADAKETLALLYRRIAEHVRSFGAVHAPIAEAFDQLAAEELMHRAAILTASETRPAGKDTRPPSRLGGLQGSPAHHPLRRAGSCARSAAPTLRDTCVRPVWREH